MKPEEVVMTILDEAKMHEVENAVLWECPTIAPVGYSDFCGGQKIFRPYWTNGLPTVDKVAFYVVDKQGTPNFLWAQEISLSWNEEEIRTKVCSAFRLFRSEMGV